MPPDLPDDVPAGVGAELARWAIDAMNGRPHGPEVAESAEDAVRLRRVNAAIEALRAARPSGGAV